MGTSFQTQCDYLKSKRMTNSMPLQFALFSWKGSVYHPFPIDRKAAKKGVLMSVSLIWSQVASFTHMWNQSRRKVLPRTDKKGQKENDIVQGDEILDRAIIVGRTFKTSPIFMSGSGSVSGFRIPYFPCALEPQRSSSCGKIRNTGTPEHRDTWE